MNEQKISSYIQNLPDERQKIIKKLRNIIKINLSEGFEETFNYNMIGYVVPHSIYPKGYHVNPEDPLPFINLASQKNFIALYHMGLYADEDLLKWFSSEYKNACKTRLDIGKSCIRFKQLDDIPYELIGRLAGKVTVNEWIKLYERALKKK